MGNVCSLVKIAKAPVLREAETQPQEKHESVFTDIMGPFRVESLSRFRYCTVSADQCKKYVFVDMVRAKSEALTSLGKCDLSVVTPKKGKRKDLHDAENLKTQIRAMRRDASDVQEATQDEEFIAVRRVSETKIHWSRVTQKTSHSLRHLASMKMHWSKFTGKSPDEGQEQEMFRLFWRNHPILQRLRVTMRNPKHSTKPRHTITSYRLRTMAPANEVRDEVTPRERELGSSGITHKK